MSSYLNKQAPPPPPPKTAIPPPTSSSTLPTSSEPPRTKPSHRHKQSIHYNDAPDLAALADSAGGGGGSTGVNRSRSSRVSRVPALPSLQSTPSTSGTTTPFNARASAEKDELALPAFNAPPLPPPLPQSSIRTGPRSLPYDILHYPPPSLSTKLIILFIPGNPGLIDYYRSFLSTLQSTLPSHIKESTELYAIGHLGHSLEAERTGMVKGFKPNQQASLEEQVSSKCEFVDELFEKHGKEVKIMILGHSIGSWICLQMLRLRRSISSAHLLFPTITHMSLTPNGQKLSPLFSSWTLRPLFFSTSFLSYLPTSLLSSIVSLLTGQRGPGSSITTQLVSSPQTVIAAITMARKELESVSELDRELVKEVGGKCWWYWTEEGRDGWVREECVEEIESTLGEGSKGRRERCKEGMPHAFVLNQDHSDSLARKCAGWIVKDLESTKE